VSDEEDTLFHSLVKEIKHTIRRSEYSQSSYQTREVHTSTTIHKGLKDLFFTNEVPLPPNEPLQPEDPSVALDNSN
jgi:hypothetical protein